MTVALLKGLKMIIVELQRLSSARPNNQAEFFILVLSAIASLHIQCKFLGVHHPLIDHGEGRIKQVSIISFFFAPLRQETITSHREQKENTGK